MYNRDQHFIDSTYAEYQEYNKQHVAPLTFSIKIKEGDLFTAPSDWSLAHCVSRDFRMGKGIAKEFSERFGGVTELKNQNKKVGEVAKLRRGNRNIYYLITKERYYDKPTYEDLWNTLRQLRHICEEDQVTQLALPQIGCGLDELKWKEVLAMLNFIFYGANIDITVYSWTPVNTTSINIVSKKEFELIWDKEMLKKAQDKDAHCQNIKLQMDRQKGNKEDTYFIDKDGVLYMEDTKGMRDKLVVPKSFVKKVLEECHDSPMAGHQGQQKTLQNVQKRFVWPGMRADVNKYCLECESCNQRKTSPHMKKAPLQRFTETYEPWELTSMDIVGPLVT